MVAFPSHSRKAFSGLALVIVRSLPNEQGDILLSASTDDLESAEIKITTN
jgi:beta-galactosidase